MFKQAYDYILSQMEAMNPLGPTNQQQDGPFEPSPVDVLVLKAMIQKARVLPVEIVDGIIEFAEYWPCSHSYVEYRNSVTGHESRAFRQDADAMLIRTPPVGFRNPLTDRYSTDEAIPPGYLLNECELKHFEKYLGEAMPPLKHPVRKVVFTIKSRDQGWGGGADTRGGYHGSYTWFEAGLEKFDTDAKCSDETEGQSCSHRPINKPDHFLPYCKLRSVQPAPRESDGKVTHGYDLIASPRYLIQSNKVAGRSPMTHTITWTWHDDIPRDSPEAEDLTLFGRGQATGDGEFVRSLEVGDVITVWVKSRFPGWVNNVYSVKVSVYWAV